MSLLVVDKTKLLGSGNERVCFIHPHDESKCLKINQEGIAHRNQNKIEYFYLNHLKKRSVPFNHLAEYYGEISTDLGSALIFERILDDDGKPSIRFDKAIEQGLIDRKLAKNLLIELNTYLIKYAVFVGDCNPDQILLQCTSSGYRLKIIDGLGTRRYGLKLIILSYIKFYARLKMKAKWDIIFNTYL